MIRILFDVRRATWQPHLGISRYVRGLVAGIAELGVPELELVPLDLAGSRRWPGMSSIAVGSGHTLVRRLVQEQVAMRRASREGDLLHLPWHEGPAIAHCPLVVTLHDLDPLERPGGYRRRFRAYYNSLLRLYVRAARRILVPSHATLEALESRWPGRPYVLIRYGVDSVFSAIAPVDGAVSAPFILYTGGFGGRKRLPDLVTAFDRVAESDGEVRLVVTGRPDDESLSELRSARHAARIDLAGAVDDGRLAELYREAAVVVYPAEGEGFGFPVVEAFASGTPVVACESGSVPEVAGGAALLAAPRRPTELADALLSVLTDASLAVRLRQEGLARAGRFSWKETARLTVDAYREALN